MKGKEKQTSFIKLCTYKYIKDGGTTTNDAPKNLFIE